jgi:hypothetical protein
MMLGSFTNKKLAQKMVEKYPNVHNSGHTGVNLNIISV